MGIEGWRRKAQDRDQWRRTPQEAKAHVGLLRQVMRMMTRCINWFPANHIACNAIYRRERKSYLVAGIRPAI
jgi:hypothetical protein